MAELEEVNVSAAEENKASNGRLSSATLKIYLRCFKSDFDAVKSKFDLKNEDNLKNEEDLKMKMTSKMMTTSKIKTT